RGIKEYLDHIRGCADDLRDYVADESVATPLLGLLEEPVTDEAKTALAKEAMRGHLAQAMADAQAVKLKIDQILEAVKPDLMGYYRNGPEEFERKLISEVREKLAEYKSGEGGEKPWKVE
ncbi:MAG: hypothetical protein JRI34_12590, partial [Deltaproteobacteria bacterium]|nr:hypothetical protein [Deltaproteobacteria bacterium]